MSQSPSEILEIKTAVRIRDGYCCVECGVTNRDHRTAYGSSLEVHRLTPGSAYSLSGCVTLCKICHGPKPRLSRGERRYNGKVRLVLQSTVGVQRAIRLAAAKQGRRVNELTDDILRKALAPALAELAALRNPSPS